ncbi:MAG: GntR family transcriptional regulator [Thermoleophilia bacterium]|nr:GntR family transcriptional regulator [Thermoleophilia bacterium]
MKQASSRGEAIQLVTRELRNEILDGFLAPGERIGQAAVAERFGVSRLPVREALRALQNEGLVTIVPNAGARVVRLDATELDEIYWLRERLEPAAIAESVPLLTAEDLRAIREHAEEMERIAAAGDTAGWLAIDVDFHRTLLSRAPLPEVRRMIARLWNVARPYRLAYLQTSFPESLLIGHMEHRLLLDAAERGDPVDAERLLAIHIRRTRLALREHSELFDS